MTVWLQIGGRQQKVELRAAGGGDALEGLLTCSVDGEAVLADARMLRPGVLSLVVDGRQYRCMLDGKTLLIDGERHEFEVADPRSLGARRGASGAADGAQAVKAPMPGRVVRVLVEAGERVAAGQGLVVIEAMKMQNELRSPKAGTVARLAVAAGDTVQAGSVLAVVE